jgi:hypothetical protein
MSRLNQVINSPITLNYIFYDGHNITSPHSFNKVELYKVNSNNTGTLIETLTSPHPNIIETSPGIFQYTFSPVTESGIYYDKVYITPVPGGGEFTDSIEFSIRDISLTYNGTPQTQLHPTCRVYGTILKPDGQPMIGTRIVANITVFPARINSTDFSMTQTKYITYTNEIGYFYLDLVRSVNYRILIRDILYDSYITVPNAENALLWSLSQTKEIGDDTTNDVTAGQTSW